MSCQHCLSGLNNIEGRRAICGLSRFFRCALVGAGVGIVVTAELVEVSAQSPEFVPVTDTMLQEPAPGDWLTWRRTLDSWGYSPLDQVNRENVGELRMVWSRGLEPVRQEGTPLAYDGVLYMPQASDVIQAISAATGETIWLYEQRAATMSLVATGGGLVFGGDVNGRFRAFDQGTDEVLWEINFGSPVSGFPISYARDGRRYVAVSTGVAATTSSFTRLTPELRPSSGNNIFVFALLK